MEKIKLVLTLITIAITVIPVVSLLLTYQDNLVGLFIPPEINEIVNKFSGGGDGSDGPELQPIGPPEYDPLSRTIRQAIQFENTFPFDITLKSLSGDVHCVEHGFDLGVAALENSVSIPMEETKTVTLLIAWTEDAINHFGTAHEGEETVEVVLVNIGVDISGIQVQLEQNQIEQRMEIPNPAL